MLNPYSQKQRRPHINPHKNRDNALLNLHSNAFSPYNTACNNKELPYHTVKPLTHRPKGKENKKNRKSIKKDQFPQFAIKFRNQTFESNKINQSFSSRNHYDKNLDESFGRVNENHGSKQLISKNDNTPVPPQASSQAPPFKAKSQNKNENQAYLPKFTQALEKIFKSLDVFNRGRISQTNINKWIPESALYFLGGVFQKIKQERLNLSYAQFEALCKPLLTESGEEDLKWFIQEVSGKQTHLNISIDLTSEQKCRQNSPVIMKLNNNYINHYIEKPRQKMEVPLLSNRKEELNKNIQPIQFQQVLNNIKTKEKQLNIRLNSMKQKHQNTIKNTTNQSESTNPTHEFSFFNSHNNNQNPTTLKHDPLEFKSIKIENSSEKCNKPQTNNYACRSNQKSTDVPNFTFQLPRQIFELKNITFQNNLSKQSDKNDISPDYANSLSVPKTSRIVRQSIPKEITNSCSKRSSMNAQETDRLDKLSSRLEEYIKFNKEKIEQNKRFIKQNSTPRK